jgi:hypothetical protein
MIFVKNHCHLTHVRLYKRGDTYWRERTVSKKNQKIFIEVIDFNIFLLFGHQNYIRRKPNLSRLKLYFERNFIICLHLY